MKKYFQITIVLFLFYLSKSFAAENTTIYKKIDLFGEVLEKIKKEYVDEIDQSDMIDSAINGALQSLGRNPEARGPIQQSMILAIAFTEAIAIYALVVAILILFVL